MEELLLEVNTYEPNQYHTEDKKYDIVKIAFYNLSTFDFGLVKVNNIVFEKNHKLIKYVLDELLLPSGKLMLRIEVRDLSSHNDNCKFKEAIWGFIKNDQMAFFAQGIYVSVSGKTVVKTYILGIAKRKEKDFKGVVRFISIKDKLVKINNRSEFKGVPHSWQDCINSQSYVVIENGKVVNLRPYEYLPLPQLELKETGIDLGKFMVLCDDHNSEPVRLGLDNNKFTLEDNFELFEDYTKYLKELVEQLPTSKKPYYYRRIIKNSAIVFKVGSDIESVLFINPAEPIFINSPRADNKEYRVAIQLKTEWSDKIDIEYIYLETRKPYFLNQFFYHNGVLDKGLKLSSSTILKARIAKLPTLDEQRLIVKKEKNEIFKQRGKDFELHKKLFNYEAERESLSEKLKEADRNANRLKQEIVDSDPELKSYLSCCDAIVEHRRKEALQLLYFILPIKKSTEESIPCNTSGLGNKARILLECVIQTLKQLHVVPVSFNISQTISFICRDDVDWITEISPDLRKQLLNIKKPINVQSHNEKALEKNEVLAITNTMISLMEWLKDFASKNADKNQNLNKWVKNYEVKTSYGTMGRNDVVGVVVNEWTDKRTGKRIGACLKPIHGGTENIMIPRQLVTKNKLGYGSMVKVNAIKRGYTWQTTELEIVNNCPDLYQFTK